MDRMLEQLRSDRAADRDRAELELKLRGESASGSLAILLKDADPEVASRAKNILEAQARLKTLTPGLLRAMPDARKRIAASLPEAWTRLFLEAAQHAELRREDLLPLALPAAQTARRDDWAAVSGAVAAWRLTPALLAMDSWLDENDWEIRRFVVDAFEYAGDASVAPRLLERARSNGGLNSALWYGLAGRMGLREVVPDLLGMLEPAGRERPSVGDLPRMVARFDAQEAVPVLLRGLRVPRMDTWEFLRALQMLAPDEIYPALREELSNSDPKRRFAAATVLSTQFITPKALPDFRKMMEDPALRAQGLAGLGNLRRRDLIPELRAQLEDPAAEIRSDAARLLATFRDKSGLPELVLGLRNAPNPQASLYVFRMLGAREVIPDLLPFLDDPKTRGFTIDILGAIGAPEARPLAEEGLKDPSAEIRTYAAVALANLDGRKSIPRLLELQKDPDPGIRENLVPHLLAYFHAKEVLPMLMERLKSTEVFGRTSAFWQIVAALPAEAGPILSGYLDDPNHFTRASAAEFLGKVHHAPAILRLKQLLRDQEQDVRRAAASSLAWLGEREGVSALLRDAGYQGNYFELNGVRSPQQVRKWSRWLSGADVLGSQREVLDEICRREGLAVEHSPDLVWSFGVNDVQVEGHDLLKMIHDQLSIAGGAVLEDDKLRLLAPRENRHFWLKWWGGELKKSPSAEDRQEGETLLASVEESNRRLTEWKNSRIPAPKPTAADIERLLTPFLKAVPGLPEFLTGGNDEEWTQAFLKASQAYAHREFEGVGQADLEALAARALRGAGAEQELTQILRTGAEKKLLTLRPFVEEYLKHRSAQVRIHAAHVLLAIDGPKGLDTALALLNDPDPSVRSGVIGVIGQLGMTEAVPRLQLRKDEPAIRQGLVNAASTLGLEEYLPDLLVKLKKVPNQGDNYQLRMSTVFPVISLGNPSISAEVLDCLTTENHPNVVDMEMRLLAGWGYREAIPVILDKIENPGFGAELYLHSAYESLATLGAREAGPLLVKQLQKNAPQVDPLASVIAQLGLTEGIPGLRKLLSSENLKQHPGVAVALGQLGDVESREPLRNLLTRADIEIRAAAALGLVLLGDRESFPSIIKFFEGSPHLPERAREALALIRTPEARALLSKHVSYSPPRFNVAMAPGGPDVMANLRGFLTHADVWHRWGAVRALGFIDGDETTADLRRIVKEDADDNVRRAAASMLCRRGILDGVVQTWAQARTAYAAAPFDLNGVRSPLIWAKLKRATLKDPYYGPVKGLVEKAAAAADFPLEGLPETSREYPAWANVYVRISAADLPLSVIDVLDRVPQNRWMMILESDRLRIVAYREAMAFWNEWVQKEKR